MARGYLLNINSMFDRTHEFYAATWRGYFAWRWHIVRAAEV
jgi:hypothetical protein